MILIKITPELKNNINLIRSMAKAELNVNYTSLLPEFDRLANRINNHKPSYIKRLWNKYTY